MAGQGFTLKDAQTDFVSRALDEATAAGHITARERDRRLAEYNNRLKEGEPVTRVPQLEAGTDAGAVNQEYDALATDLSVLFGHFDRTDEVRSQHRRLAQSALGALHLRLAGLEEELERLERLRHQEYGGHNVYVSFRGSGSMATEDGIYRTLTGEILPTAQKARLDLTREALTLPLITSENALITPIGTPRATIEITRQLGGELPRLTGQSYGLDRAIDTSPDTFWQETILAPQPLCVDMGPALFNWKRGAAVELTVRFEQVMAINELTVSPFAEYPIDLIAVWYKDTDSAAAAETLLIGPTAGARTRGLGSALTDTPVAYQFPEVHIKELRVLLGQRHYVPVEVTETRPVHDLAGSINRQIEAAIGATDPDSLSELPDQLSMTTTAHRRAYQYEYGLADLGLKRQEYLPKGVFVSTPFRVPDAVASVTLITEEIHPQLSDGAVCTAITYSLSVDDGLTWAPLTPGSSLPLNELAHYKTERFAGTSAGGRISLEFTPDLTLDALSVMVADAGGRRYPVTIITGRLDPFDAQANNYQARLIGQAIQFNRVMDASSHLITATYAYSVGAVRLRAELSRQSGAPAGMTPVLNGYLLQFHTRR